MVKVVKLVSGEEIVCEVLYENSMDITIKNPLMITMRPTQTGDLQIGFIPYAPYLGKNPSITINRGRIIFVQEVDENMRNQYNSIFGGIVVPPKQLLVD